MILVDKPYLSEFLKETSIKHARPIIATKAAAAFGLGNGDNLITEKEVIEQLRSNQNTRI